MFPRNTSVDIKSQANECIILKQLEYNKLVIQLDIQEILRTDQHKHTK